MPDASDPSDPSDPQLEGFFAALAERAGTAPVTSAEADAVLDLARVVAHGAERRFAPVAAYAVGLALGADGAAGAAQRAEAVRTAIAAVEALLAADRGTGSDAGA